MLRISTIDFLNPAPLLYNFEHHPHREDLLTRYELHYTMPAICARELADGTADLGLIPIAALSESPHLHIVPGCVIASLNEVRSIQLISKLPLEDVRSIATDTSSRSSVAYTQILFRHFLQRDPVFHNHPPHLEAMLREHDAALLIGDPALLAIENCAQIESHLNQPLHWHDLATEWEQRTNLPWVAAIWAVNPAALNSTHTRETLINDLTASRNNGLNNIPTLVQEWTPRIPIPPTAIHHYLTHNIHYTLTPACVETIRLFHKLAAEVSALPPAPHLNFL